ncbi:DUF2975 domain-containing protein [Mangrovimonas spongiae]|uniref:DUF2975 domain-containing protein n=1 Tax=Mangrovimonas spongiae TaxID=2494697 RepID=A0A3R9N8V1_9FLAO|nr:DUF2975 domain-containing protein [Mangrovimonas spongiae]RSK41688.1 DUF2975 domain-containing protein [Mangrovimonas spongiae]
MKKVKILYTVIFISIVLYIIHFIMNTFLMYYKPEFLNFPKTFYSQFIFGYYTQFVSLFFSILTFIALFYVKSGLGVIIKEGFFNAKCSKQFKISGNIFLITGSLSFLWYLLLLFYSKGKMPISGASDVLLIIIGLGMLVITDIVKNGHLIKKENDLTI